MNEDIFYHEISKPKFVYKFPDLSYFIWLNFASYLILHNFLNKNQLITLKETKTLHFKHS